MQTENFCSFVIDTIDSMKAENIVNINVADKTSLTDNMIICTGNSRRHVKSIADNLAKESREILKVPFINIEGETDGQWAVIDLGSVIVHVMQEQYRDIYQLEKLWS